MISLNYLTQFAQGCLLTLELMAGALSLGIICALVMTLAVISPRGYLRLPVKTLIFFIRGTPVLVQLFLIYYGLAQFDWLKTSILWPLLREPFACAVIALALNTSAYTTVLLEGAINAVPKNEILACQALGMSRALSLRRIILPQAIRMALPAYSNEVVMVLKATSLASTITLLDIMGVANKLGAETYDSVSFLLIAGLLYLALNSLLIAVSKYAEGHWGRYIS